MRCNICGSEVFKDVNGRRNAVCNGCGSYERTRLMKMEVDRLFPKENRSGLRCLHIAPEYGLATILRSTFGVYVPADINVARYAHMAGIRKIDLCDAVSLSSFGTFDLIIHAHVIEHIPCNYTVALVRLHKMLSPCGYQLFSVPIYGDSYEESLARLTPEEATKRFGQFDHVRRFSSRDITQTIGAIFRIEDKPSLRGVYSDSELERNNIPSSVIDTYTGHYCFSPAVTDLLV